MVVDWGVHTRDDQNEMSGRGAAAVRNVDAASEYVQAGHPLDLRFGF